MEGGRRGEVMDSGGRPSLGQFILLGTSSVVTAFLYSVYRQKAQVSRELKVSAGTALASAGRAGADHRPHPHLLRWPARGSQGRADRRFAAAVCRSRCAPGTRGTHGAGLRAGRGRGGLKERSVAVRAATARHPAATGAFFITVLFFCYLKGLWGGVRGEPGPSSLASPNTLKQGAVSEVKHLGLEPALRWDPGIVGAVF